MRSGLQRRVLELVKVAKADELKSVACPKCAGGLTIQFAESRDSSKGAGSLMVMCAKCMWRIIADGIPSKPPWVRELGWEVRTKVGDKIEADNLMARKGRQEKGTC